LADRVLFHVVARLAIEAGEGGAALPPRAKEIWRIAPASAARRRGPIELSNVVYSIGVSFLLSSTAVAFASYGRRR